MSYIGNTSTTQTYAAAIDYFSGNGSTTAFTLSRPVASVAQLIVVVANVPQNPNSAFTVAGNTITFTSAPPSGTNNIWVEYTSPITQTIAPSDGTVGTSQLQNNLTLTNPSYTGTLTGGTGVVNIGSGQIYKDASGNVGIGTSSPNQKLDVQSAVSATPVTNGVVRIVTTGSNPATGSGGGLLFAQQDSGGSFVNYASITGLRVNNAANNKVDLCFATGSPSDSIALAERMRIDASGNLYMGATTSGIGTARSNFWNDGTNASINLVNTSASNNPPVARFYSAFASGANSANGAVFLNSIGLQVGSITFTGSATAYNTSSDYRLKENIAPMQNALGVISKLKPVTYTWKSDGSAGQGFIAHELQAVVPDCVTGDKDAVDAEGNPVYQGIDTSFLVATLTAAIQEQQTIINDLKSRIEVLENK